MSVTLTGTGGLFTRWGKLIGGSNESCVALNTTLRARADTIEAQYQSAQQDVVDSLYSDRDSAFQAMGGWLGNLQSFMQNTVVEMCYDDAPGINPKDVNTSLDKIILQMVADNASINRPTITASAIPDPLNYGNGALIVSLVNPITGNPTDMVFDETIAAVCTDDSYPGGGATEGQEPWTFTGEIAADALSVEWPLGSGASATLTTQNASSTGQMITDGDFEEWGGSGNNTPTQWTIAVGTAGTTIFRGASAYVGSYDMQFTGNGSELTCIRQDLTLTDFEPQKSYGFLIRMKTDGSVAAGAVRIRLVDESNAVISDELGTANSVSQAVTSLTSSYTTVEAFFRMPKVMSFTQIKLEIALTTAITNTEVLHMDSAGLVEATPLYDGGPLVAMFRGSTPYAIDDKWIIIVTNNLTTTSFVRSLDRWFDLRTNNKEIPSAVSETIPDNLIS